MAKQFKKDPITSANLIKYRNEESDFDFELRILQRLNPTFKCRHGGTYFDPVKEINREFDIRAVRSDPPRRLLLAVECKNIKAFHPLVIHTRERLANESHHDIISNQKTSSQAPFRFRVNRNSEHSFYEIGKQVGKSIDQVGIDKGGNFITGDERVYTKSRQAINSCFDLLREACRAPDVNSAQPLSAFICPILVIPDFSLWRISYHPDGRYAADPETVDHISLYDGTEWIRNDIALGITYNISHLEIVTESRLIPFVESVWNSGKSKWMIP